MLFLKDPVLEMNRSWLLEVVSHQNKRLKVSLDQTRGILILLQNYFLLSSSCFDFDSHIEVVKTRAQCEDNKHYNIRNVSNL